MHLELFSFLKIVVKNRGTLSISLKVHDLIKVYQFKLSWVEGT